jgi:NAD(P)-dependent dehydrogenase (short-subunit alcohol dehydrogenase family)
MMARDMKMMPESPHPEIRDRVSGGSPLSGQAVIVTGGSRGIGLAIARRLARLGAKVCICARNASRLHSARAELEREGMSILAVQADVTRAAEIQAVLQQATAAHGETDILVNNAGVGVFGPAHLADESDWNRILDTNLKGVWLFSKAVAPGMIRRGRGHIINIGSLAGKNTFPGGGIYCASKWGLMGLTGCMAEDLRGYGIRVSVICPGTVHTEFSPHAGKDPQRMLQPEDVAHAVEMVVLQAPQSFISEIHLRPTQKP